MAQDYIVKDSELKSIANAIRSKTGNPDPLTFPTEFVSEIGTLSNPSGTIQISQNGSVNVRDYANANVSVSPVLQEKTGIVPTENSQTITADPPNQGLSSVQIDPIDSNYVGSDVPRRDSTDLTDSGATVSVPAGYYGSNASKTVASGSATTPATTITANPSISVDSSGLITATASASQNITPTVSEGYVSSGTAGAVTVSGSNTSQLNTQSGTTVTPTESEQTAVASGKYTTGAVKVGAIPSTYVGSGITRRDETDLTASGATVTVPSGFYEETETKSVASGTAGTPTATKGAVSNHSVTVTPSVTNTTGYITGSTKTGTAVTVSASELVSGSQTITENDTYDVTNLSTIVVNVSGGGGGVVIEDTTDVHGGTIREITATVISGSQTITQNGTYDVTSLASVTVNVSGGGSADLKGIIERTAVNPTLPDDLTSIGSYAFYYCTNLELTSLPSGVTTIGSYAFQNCQKLALTSLPSGVTSIGSYAFYYCSYLALTSLPSGVTTIPTYAFYNCYKLALTSLPSGVTSIANYAFQNCTSLALTSLPSGVTTIPTYAFYGCSDLALTSLPSGVTSIGSYAFYGCSDLALTSLPSGVTTIQSSVFRNCTGLHSFTFHSGISSIGTYAFNSCTGLQELHFQRATPPTVSSSNAWTNIPTTCTIYVPTGSLSAYTTATNYPSSATYTYVEE